MEKNYNSAKILGFLVLGIVIILGSFFFIYNSLEQKYENQSSFDYWIEQTLAGKESENNYEYNGYVFVRSQDSTEWETRGFTQAGTPYSIKSYFGPRDVDYISMPNQTIIDIFAKPTVLISLDSNIDDAGFFPQATIGAIEISKILGTRNNLLNKRVVSGVANPSNSTLNITVIDCSFVTANQSVIYYTMANETSITYQNGCTIVSAPDGSEFVKASDRIMFGLLGVIER